MLAAAKKKKGKAGRGKTTLEGKTNPPAHAKQSWQGGKKMGKGGQENEALTTPCAWPGCCCLLLFYLFSRPLDSRKEWEKKHLAGTCLILAEQRPTALFIRVLWHICADQVNMT